MKMGPNALDTVENGSGSAKHENGTRPPRYRPKRVRERKMKTGPDPLGTVKNESGSAKLKNGTRRARYRQ
jgi:hypothetical protein